MLKETGVERCVLGSAWVDDDAVLARHHCRAIDPFAGIGLSIGPERHDGRAQLREKTPARAYGNARAHFCHEKTLEQAWRDGIVFVLHVNCSLYDASLPKQTHRRRLAYADSVHTLGLWY